MTTETQRGANGRAVLAATAGRGERAGTSPPRTDRGDGAAVADRGAGPSPGPGGDGPVAEAAVGYARSLGWPLTPGYPVDGELCGCGFEQCPDYGAHPVPGAWKVAACATPSLVRVIWRMSVGAPVLAVLGRPVPGAARLGAVRVPALIGVAALELLSKRTAAEGPAVDGHGRISFLVDLGPGTETGDRALAEFERWRQAGVDLAVLGTEMERAYVPLPTPGFSGRSGVVWAVPPEADRNLPPVAAVIEVFDRAMRSTYPSLWSTVRSKSR